jgi:hypothetical protein
LLGTRKICSALGALPDQKGGTKLETRIAVDNQMAMKIKIELELQAIKSIGTATIRTQRYPGKSNEEKQVGHTRSKIRALNCNLK